MESAVAKGSQEGRLGRMGNNEAMDKPALCSLESKTANRHPMNTRVATPVTKDQALNESTIHGIPLEDESLGSLTLGGFLRDVCRMHSQREALVFQAPSGEVVRWTYDQLWEKACAVARALLARGVTKETRVGVLATNRPEWIAATFGVTLAGGTCVSMSTFASRDEFEYQLRIGDVSILIFERSVLKRDFAAELLQLVPDFAQPQTGPIRSTHLPFLRGAVCIDDGNTVGGAVESWPDFLRSAPASLAPLMDAISAEVAPTDRGMIFFSSGSTAKPKAIMHSHRAAAIQCWRWRRIFCLDPHVRTWTANGFFWSGNFTMALGSTFAAGGCLVLQRFFVTDEALRLIKSERVSMPLAWPHQWAKLVEDPAYQSTDLSSLYYVPNTAPMRTHPTVKTDWWEPASAYGNTETLTINSAWPADAAPEVRENNHGIPLPGNTIRIVDPITGRVLPREQAGEIAVKGPTLMLGYLRIPAEDTFDNEGFFRTGDGGFVDAQGRLHWQGRLNDIIKTGGANVSPLEINEVIAECPGVKIIATVGVPHDTLGEIVVACVVPEEGAKLDESTVRAFASQKLSSYKVPRRVLFVAESDLELSSSNKVKTGPLRELVSKRLA
jgi:fatty-acyl-CoA synthase